MLQEVRDQLNVDKGRELSFKEGHERGLAEGHEAGLQEGHKAGLAEGHAAGLQKSHEAGLQEGLNEGELRFANLATRLIEEGRAADVARAGSEVRFRESLYRQYGIQPSSDS